MTKQNLQTSYIPNNGNLKIPSREEFHKTFGGRIYVSDYNADYCGHDNINGSQIASRIESDKKWETKLLSAPRYKY